MSRAVARQFKGETTGYSKHGLIDVPAEVTVQPVSTHDLTLEVDPPAFFARINLWRKGDVTGAHYEARVSGSRSPKFLEFDGMDAILNAAEAEYRSHLVDASTAKQAGDEVGQRKALRKALVLQAQWLKPIVTPSPEMVKRLNKLVSDAQSCATCEDTKEAWVARRKKAGVRSPIWRIRVSPDGKPDCAACYQKKRRDRLAELAVIDPDPQAVAS
jgi:hypothetical protein